MPGLSQDLWSGKTFPLRSRKVGVRTAVRTQQSYNPKFEGNISSRPTYTGGTNVDPDRSFRNLR